jgi:hypothetical protein
MSASLRPDDIANEPSGSTVKPEEPWYRPIAEFAGHIVGGTAIFLLIAGAAWVLHMATEAIGADKPFMKMGLTVAEVVTFSGDTVLFVLFVIRTSWRAGRRLLQGWNV